MNGRIHEADGWDGNSEACTGLAFEDLSAFMDRELPPPKMHSIEVHLKSCARCRKIMAAVQRVDMVALSVAPQSHGCLSEELAAAFAEGRVDSATHVRVERHLAECPKCLSSVELLHEVLVPDAKALRRKCSPSWAEAVGAFLFLSRRRLAYGVLAVCFIAGVVIAVMTLTFVYGHKVTVLAEGDLGERIAEETQDLERAQTEGDHLAEGRALFELGSLYEGDGNAVLARTYYDAAQKVFEAVGGSDVISARVWIARIRPRLEALEQE